MWVQYTTPSPFETLYNQSFLNTIKAYQYHSVNHLSMRIKDNGVNTKYSGIFTKFWRVFDFSFFLHLTMSLKLFQKDSELLYLLKASLDSLYTQSVYILHTTWSAVLIPVHVEVKTKPVKRSEHATLYLGRN